MSTFRSVSVFLSGVTYKGVCIRDSLACHSEVDEESVCRNNSQPIILFCAAEFGHEWNTRFWKNVMERCFPLELQGSVFLDII